MWPCGRRLVLAQRGPWDSRMASRTDLLPVALQARAAMSRPAERGTRGEHGAAAGQGRRAIAPRAARTHAQRVSLPHTPRPRATSLSTRSASAGPPVAGRLPMAERSCVPAGSFRTSGRRQRHGLNPILLHHTVGCTLERHSRGRVWAGSAAGVAAGRLPRRAAMVDVIDYYDEAEEYLEHISDDIPLFTNTRDGVFSEGARTAPAPLESNSDLFVSPMRAQLASRRAQKASMPASGGVASAAARFEGRGGGPLAPRASGINGGKPLGSARVQEAAVQEQPIEIPDLQDGIADLQMGDSDEEKDEEEVDTADDFGDIPVAPSRSTETSPQLQPKSHGSPPSDKSPGLPDKMMSELAFANAEGRDVSPHVIQGLVQIMRDGAHEKRKKATIAMCNLCCESQQV